MLTNHILSLEQTGPGCIYNIVLILLNALGVLHFAKGGVI